MTNGASRGIKVERCHPNDAVSLSELPHHRISPCEGVHTLRIAPATMVMF